MLRLGLSVGSLATLPWILILALRWFGPIRYEESGVAALQVVGLFLLGIWAAVLFWVLAPRRPGRTPSMEARESRRSGLATAGLATLSLIYLGAILLDKSEVAIYGVTGLRYQEIASGGEASLLGGVHQYLSGAPAILALMLIGMRVPSRNPVTRPLLWVLVGTCFASYFLAGGRNGFIIATGFVALGAVLERFVWGRSKAERHVEAKQSLRHRLMLLIGATLGVAYSGYLFVERAAVRNTDLRGSVGILGSEYGASSARHDLPSLLGGLHDIVILGVFYVTHSIGYLSQYLEEGYRPMTGGAYSFQLFARTGDLIAGTSFGTDAIAALIVPGVYLTLPGSFYVDFGLPGAFGAGALGTLLLLTFLRDALVSQRFGSVALASYLGLLMLLAPFYSITGIALGPSLLVLVSVTWIGDRLSFSPRPATPMHGTIEDDHVYRS